MNLKHHIGIRVRAARTKRDLTQEEVAEQIGKAVETVSNIERGQTLTGLDTLERLSRCLQVPVSEFFEGYDAERAVHKNRVELEQRLLDSARSLSDQDLKVSVDLVEVLSRHRQR